VLTSYSFGHLANQQGQNGGPSNQRTASAVICALEIFEASKANLLRVFPAGSRDGA